jgi:hypothetical protein
VIDAGGWRLAKARLPEGVAGIARLHAMHLVQLAELLDHVGVRPDHLAAMECLCPG